MLTAAFISQAFLKQFCCFCGSGAKADLSLPIPWWAQSYNTVVTKLPLLCNLWNCCFLEAPTHLTIKTIILVYLQCQFSGEVPKIPFSAAPLLFQSRSAPVYGISLLCNECLHTCARWITSNKQLAYIIMFIIDKWNTFRWYPWRNIGIKFVHHIRYLYMKIKTYMYMYSKRTFITPYCLMLWCVAYCKEVLIKVQ